MKYKIKYFFSGSKVIVEKGGALKVKKNVTIKNSNIYIQKGGSLVIKENTTILNCMIYIGKNQKKWNEIVFGKSCRFENYTFNLNPGSIHIGDYNIFIGKYKFDKPAFVVQGALKIGDYNRIRCGIWSRFKADITIGSRNAINEGTEIRSDESITIGHYNQISYDCMIWDTNTHNLYKAKKRREITDRQYPAFGLEYEKPTTIPVSIASDCWIGKGASILKGTSIANKCIVGYGTLLNNISITENKTIINQRNLKLTDNQL